MTYTDKKSFEDLDHEDNDDYYMEDWDWQFDEFVESQTGMRLITNFDEDKKDVYEKAIEEAGLNEALVVQEAYSGLVKPDGTYNQDPSLCGLYIKKKVDLTEFWEIKRRMDRDMERCNDN